MTAGASWPLWGGIATVLVAEEHMLEAGCAAVRLELERFDATLSSFRDDSELQRVNRACGRWQDVSDLFLDALEAALRAAHLTGGAVDPALGTPPLRLAAGGCPRSLRVVPRADWRSIEVDRAHGRVRVPSGIALDLGATGKALAADRCAAAARRATRCGVLVSLGGDIATAGAAPPGGWTVGVGDDHRRAGDGGCTVAIFGGALASSSVVARPGHIVDPRRRAPVRGPWRSASVAAASCVDANTASTAAIVLGPRGRDWLERSGLPARLVGREGDSIELGGWDAA